MPQRSLTPEELDRLKDTPFGVMKGTYQMLTREGERFESEIAPFYLQGPYSVH